jgi:hypothetical protein
MKPRHLDGVFVFSGRLIDVLVERSSGIIFSLFYEFNLSAFAIEMFWLVISLYGVFRALRLRKALINKVENPKDDPV